MLNYYPKDFNEIANKNIKKKSSVKKGLEGELKVFEKLITIFKNDSDVFIRWNAKSLNNIKQMDILIFHKHYGLMNLEIKNWEKNWFYTQGINGETDAIKQSKEAIESLKEFFSNEYKINQDIPYLFRVFFINQKKSDFQSNKENKNKLWGKEIFNDDKTFKEMLLKAFKDSYQGSKVDVSQDEGMIIARLRDDNLFYKLDIDAYKKSRKVVIEKTKKIQEVEVKKLLKKDNAVIFGEAGAGKTHIAIQLGMDLIKLKKKGIYFVYNALVKIHIEKLIEEYSLKIDQLKVVTLQSFLIDKIQYKGVLKNNGKLSKENIDKIINHFNSNEKEKYDFLIIDEMQDISLDTLEVLKKTLKDTTRGMYLFLDPKQELTLQGSKKSSSEDKYFKNLNKIIPKLVKIKLEKVIRNSKSIYSDTRDKVPKHWTVGCENDDGIPTEFHNAGKYEKLHGITIDFINKIKDVDEKLDDIIVLGNTKISSFFKKATQKNTTRKLDNGLVAPYIELIDSDIGSKENSNKIQYREVGKFKGCESDIVILWWKGNLSSFGKNKKLLENLFYIGASRAKLILCVIEFNNKKGKK
jgi:hypothetical protein